jgi:uncharacterized protein (TIGR03435 family)
MAARLRMATLATAVMLTTAVCPWAEVTAAAADGQKFETASVKPCRPEDSPPGPARGGAGGTNATFSPGRVNVPCVTVEQLIYLAYAGSGATKDEWLLNVNPGGASDAKLVRGGPAWVHSQRDKYAVEATAPDASERTVLLGAMLRTLLEERFQLKLHRDTEEEPMFALTVGKTGFKLKPMKDGDCASDRTMPVDPGAKPPCGSMTSAANGPNSVWSFNGFEVDALAARLSRTVGLHVIDRTGLTGDYIIRLQFHPDDSTPGIIMPADREADTSVPQDAAIFTALEQQLGLKLEKTKGRRGFLVIDHVERPSPNER